ncbi:Centrosomal protein of 19kDa [Trinorchestia longiramus]|nr:Centrosomal protein of 19kDa [Trinorchestia longiramus]
MAVASTSNDTTGITPLSLGIKVKPATIVLKYQTSTGSVRLRLMPVRGLTLYGPVTLQVAQLRQRHTEYLKKVPDVRLEKLVRLLQEVTCGKELDEAIKSLNLEYSVDPDQDLNKLSDAEIEKKKKIMDSSFTMNQVRPGDPGYEYDKRVEFSPADNHDAGWDSTDEFWG